MLSTPIYSYRLPEGIVFYLPELIYALIDLITTTYNQCNITNQGDWVYHTQCYKHLPKKPIKFIT
jgi:hypothetical protein